MAGVDDPSDFDETDPLEDLDLRYLQEPTDSELRSGRVIGNRYYQGNAALCSAGCGRRAKVFQGPNSLQKRKTCGDPDCLHKVMSEASKRSNRNRLRGSCSRANYGGRLPEGTPFREQHLSQEEITRIIDEGDRKTWRM